MDLAEKITTAVMRVVDEYLLLKDYTDDDGDSTYIVKASFWYYAGGSDWAMSQRDALRMTQEEAKDMAYSTGTRRMRIVKLVKKCT